MSGFTANAADPLRALDSLFLPVSLQILQESLVPSFHDPVALPAELWPLLEPGFLPVVLRFSSARSRSLVSNRGNKSGVG